VLGPRRVFFFDENGYRTGKREEQEAENQPPRAEAHGAPPHDQPHGGDHQQPLNSPNRTRTGTGRTQQSGCQGRPPTLSTYTKGTAATTLRGRSLAEQRGKPHDTKAGAQGPTRAKEHHSSNHQNRAHRQNLSKHLTITHNRCDTRKVPSTQNAHLAPPFPTPIQDRGQAARTRTPTNHRAKNENTATLTNQPHHNKRSPPTAQNDGTHAVGPPTHRAQRASGKSQGEPGGDRNRPTRQTQHTAAGNRAPRQ
jgi:hypothetical protein